MKITKGPTEVQTPDLLIHRQTLKHFAKGKPKFTARLLDMTYIPTFTTNIQTSINFK